MGHRDTSCDPHLIAEKRGSLSHSRHSWCSKWLVVPADATTINCTLLFGWICIQRLKVVLSFAPGRHGAYSVDAWRVNRNNANPTRRQWQWQGNRNGIENWDGPNWVLIPTCPVTPLER